MTSHWRWSDTTIRILARLTGIACFMFRLTRHLLLLLAAVQLAAPVGWCCRRSAESTPESCFTGATCCGHSPERTPGSNPPIHPRVNCCCPQESTRPDHVTVSGPDRPLPIWMTVPRGRPVRPEAGAWAQAIGRHDGQSCAWHVELCVWRC